MVKNKFEGLGGWLILPIAGLIISLFLYLELLAFGFPLDHSYNLLVTYSIYLITALILYSLFLIFGKKTKAPFFVILTMWLAFVFSLLLSKISNDYEGVYTSLIANVIWTRYFMVSKRVKNTFVK